MRPRAVKEVDLSLDTAEKASQWESIKESPSSRLGHDRDAKQIQCAKNAVNTELWPWIIMYKATSTTDT